MREKVVISTNKLKLGGYRWTNSLKGLDFNDISVLIFHNTIDTDVEGLTLLCNIDSKHLSKLFYVNRELHPLYYVMFSGLDADIYTEEFGLSDDAVLESMEAEYGHCDWAVRSTLADFTSLEHAMCKLTEDTTDTESLNQLISSENWKRTLSRALENIKMSIVLDDKVSKQLVPFMRGTQAQLQELQKAKEEANAELDRLVQLSKKSLESKNAILRFPTFRIPLAVPKVLYVREVGSCRFLTSFLMAYQHYLQTIKGRNARMLIAHPRLAGNYNRYKSFVALNPENVSYQTIDEKTQKCFVTLEPTAPVLQKFFTTSSSTKLFIVLDKMLGDPLLTGTKMKTLYGISGREDIANHDIKPSVTVSPLVGEADGFILPFLDTYYTSTEVQKRNLYFQNCKDMFIRLDTLLEVDKLV